jgi:hypothetical protein
MTKTLDFFARMAGKKPFTMVPWVPAASGLASLVTGNTFSKSPKLVESLHTAAGIEPINIGWGIAGVLDFVPAKDGGADDENRYAVPFVPTFYGLDFIKKYDEFWQIGTAMQQRAENIFFRGKAAPEQNSHAAEVIPLRLGEAGHGSVERMTAWAKTWLTLFLTMHHGEHWSHGGPQLWLWLDDGQIYGMVVPGAFYQHNLVHFREDTAKMLGKVLPDAEKLAPVAVQKAVLGNIHLHSAMTAGRKRAA